MSNNVNINGATYRTSIKCHKIYKDNRERIMASYKSLIISIIIVHLFFFTFVYILPIIFTTNKRVS